MMKGSLVAWLARSGAATLALGCGGSDDTGASTGAPAPPVEAGEPSQADGMPEAPGARPSASPGGEPEMPSAQTPLDGSGIASGGPTRATPDAGAAAPDAGPVAPPGTARVFLAGDSIVQTYADTPSDSDQAGWGQMLHEYFDPAVTIENRAIGGRTARRFIDEGRLDALSAELAPGDYLLVQFGTNDGNRTATYELDGEAIPYYLDPATDFKAYLERYVDAAKARSASPVFVTPTPRNSAYCTGGNGTGAHASAMRELGLALDVPVVDLNARSVTFLQAICPAPTPEDFFLLRPDGSVDGTHFQEKGARILAGFVADELEALGLLGEFRLPR
jgi:lysophospholipase L1-like esterase